MRTVDQNALLHVWCREIAAHLKERKIQNVSEATVKELILLLLGNTVELLSVKVAMRSSMYKRSDADLSPQDHKRGFISMESLLTKVVVWCSTDLNLQLSTPNEDINNG